MFPASELGLARVISTSWPAVSVPFAIGIVLTRLLVTRSAMVYFRWIHTQWLQCTWPDPEPDTEGLLLLKMRWRWTNLRHSQRVWQYILESWAEEINILQMCPLKCVVPLDTTYLCEPKRTPLIVRERTPALLVMTADEKQSNLRVLRC
jgi:hypothetical protein